MTYSVTIKNHLTTVFVGHITLNPQALSPRAEELLTTEVNQDTLDQLIFDIENSFNSRPDHDSNRFRLHIERYG